MNKKDLHVKVYLISQKKEIQSKRFSCQGTVYPQTFSMRLVLLDFLTVRHHKERLLTSEEILCLGRCWICKFSEQAGGFQTIIPPHIWKSTILDRMIIYEIANRVLNMSTINLILTGDIKPFVMDISPFGNCNFRGHSFADGTYLALRKQAKMSLHNAEFNQLKFERTIS